MKLIIFLTVILNINNVISVKNTKKNDEQINKSRNFNQNKFRDLGINFESFESIISQFQDVDKKDLKEEDRLKLSNAYLEKGVVFHKNKNYPYAYTNFKTAAYLGLKRAEEYCNFMFFHGNYINELYIDFIVKEQLTKSNNYHDQYQLGLSFKQKKGPEFRYNEKASLEAALMCFNEVLVKLESTYSLNKKEKDMLQETYYQMGVIQLFLSNFSNGTFLLYKAKDMGSTKAQKWLEQKVEN